MTIEAVKADATRPFLGEIFRLYVQTQCYHWNVERPDFRTLQNTFETQCSTLLEFMDSVAERLRVLGVKAPGAVAVLLAMSQSQPPETARSGNELLLNQCSEFLRFIDVLRAALRALSDVGDDGTVSVLTDDLEWSEKEHWMMYVATK